MASVMKYKGFTGTSEYMKEFYSEAQHEEWLQRVRQRLHGE